MKIALVLLLSILSLPAWGQAPTADDILKTARFVATLQQQDLSGQIRKGATRIPVTLFLRGENIQFQFYVERTKTWNPFHLRLEDDHYELFEMKDGKTLQFPREKIGENIEGTDLSYEDLSMRFLYWPGGIVEGSENKKGGDAWQVRLINRTGKGRYDQVRVWVHKKSGALVEVVGYNAAGRPLKRFQVNSIMKVGETYTLRQMRVDTIEPVANKVIGNTYLEFDAPKVVGPGGLR